MLQCNLTDFKGGVCWCYSFMKHHGLSMRTKIKTSRNCHKSMNRKYYLSVPLLLTFERKSLWN